MGFVLADIPDTPLNAPATDPFVTTDSIVKIDCTTVSGNGGSAITSYSLEIDNGMGGDYVAVYGVDTNSLSLTYTFT